MGSLSKNHKTRGDMYGHSGRHSPTSAHLDLSEKPEVWDPCRGLQQTAFSYGSVPAALSWHRVHGKRGLCLLQISEQHAASLTAQPLSIVCSLVVVRHWSVALSAFLDVLWGISPLLPSLNDNCQQDLHGGGSLTTKVFMGLLFGPVPLSTFILYWSSNIPMVSHFFQMGGFLPMSWCLSHFSSCGPTPEHPAAVDVFLGVLGI